MIYISEGTELNYLEAEKKFELRELINRKRFTVKDTSLSYRQVNKLDEDKLVNEDRKNTSEWRKFSLKELVFFEIIKELKAFGLEHNQLKGLGQFFLGNERRYLSDLAIGCVLGQIEITITMDSKGNVGIFDPNFYVLIGIETPHIKITLNKAVNKLVEKIGKKPFPIKYSIQDLIIGSPSLKEKELLKILRNDDYTAVSVKKKNGEIEIVHASKYSDNTNNLSAKELERLIGSKDFQDINIVKRDGKIVNLKVEEAIKL